MQLISLTTETFKKLGSRTFNFTPGVNVIAGDNGSGKSTVLRAVAVALFGPTMLPGVGDDIPTRGSSSWSVTLTFEAQGKVYEVVRGKGKASVKIGDELMASGQLPVTAYLEDLLNISAKDYNLLIHSRQGETSYVINYGATALQRKVEEFAGIAEIDKIVNEAASMAKEAKSKWEWLEGRLLSQEESTVLEMMYEETANNLAKQSTELKGLIALQPPVEPAKPSFNLSEERTKLRKYVAWTGDDAAYRRELAELNQKLGDMLPPIKVPASTELLAYQHTLKTELRDAKRSVEAASNAKVKYDLLKEQLSKLNLQPVEEVADLAVALAEEEVSDVQQQLQILNNLKSDLSLQVSKLSKEISEGVCGSCGTKLATDVDDLEKQKTDAEVELLNLTSSIAKLTAELSEITETHKQLVRAQQVAKEHARKVSEAEQQLRSLIVPAVVGDVDHLQEAVFKVAEQIKQIEAIQSEADSLERTRSRLKRSLENLIQPTPVDVVTEESVAAKELEQSIYEIDHATWKHVADNLKRDQEVKASEVKGLQEKFELLQQRRTENGKKILEQEDLQMEAGLADRLAKYLRTRRAAYLKEVWDSIMAVSSRFLGDTTRSWMTETGIEDGKFMFREEGAWVPAVETSGAQAAFLGTALRIGLNKALYRGKTFLAFDEPTEAMTEENARNLVAGIAGEAHQIFLITHRQSDQGLANNLIEV